MISRYVPMSLTFTYLPILKTTAQIKRNCLMAEVEQEIKADSVTCQRPGFILCCALFPCWTTLQNDVDIWNEDPALIKWHLTCVNTKSAHFSLAVGFLCLNSWFIWASWALSDAKKAFTYIDLNLGHRKRMKIRSRQII